jgi:hypothetical protein
VAVASSVKSIFVGGATAENNGRNSQSVKNARDSKYALIKLINP